MILFIKCPPSSHPAWAKEKNPGTKSKHSPLKAVAVVYQMQMMGRVSLFNKNFFGERFVSWAYGQEHCEESSLTSFTCCLFFLSSLFWSKAAKRTLFLRTDNAKEYTAEDLSKERKFSEEPKAPEVSRHHSEQAGVLQNIQPPPPSQRNPLPVGTRWHPRLELLSPAVSCCPWQ